MSIKNRISKLEQKQAHKGGRWTRIIVKVDETQEEATARWLDDHPGESLPEKIIYRVIVA